MRIIVIGGKGHVGTYLAPRLVEAGHEVISISRSRREPYQPHGAWTQVQTVAIDRGEAEQEGTFGRQIADLAPDVVIDMICFTLDSARQIAEALRARSSISCTAAPSGCTGPARSCRPRRNSRAGPSANTAWRRRPSRPTCCVRRG